MSLPLGSRIGPYEVVAPLGAGGMGEVYRARDTTLGRLVAIKRLPEAMAHDPERLGRFEREARALAALNHPNIAQVHGFEETDTVGPDGARSRVLVMELVEGEDLSERLARGPLPLDDAIAVARQIADALEAAHDQGVVHRDLKPANISIRPDGVVKLLDFGLAKTRGDAGLDDVVLDNSPTFTSPAVTGRGIILGTAAYMAPEQARGRVVDKRADVWAFGVVLYEMLSGRRPFGGEDTAAVIAKVIEREPDWRALPAATPPHIRRLLRRCLQKDPRLRLRDCGDARLELEEKPEPDAAGTAPAGWGRLVGVAAMAAAAGGIGVWVLTGQTVRSEPDGRVSPSRFTLVGPGQTLSSAGRLAVAISRDGRRVVFAADQRLWLRAADDLAPRPIAGSEPVSMPGGVRGNTGFATQPVLSPDGESVAYFQGRELKRLPVSGGTPTTICTCLDAVGATWGDDGNILIGRGSNAGVASGIWRVAATGGEPERLVEVPVGFGAIRPQLLPGGTHLLFTLQQGEDWTAADVVAVTLATGEQQVLVTGGMDGRYVASGLLLYGRDGTLHAVQFDPKSLRVSGAPTRVLSGVAQATQSGAWGGFGYDVSDEGTLVYQPAAAAAPRRVLVWKDRTGAEEPLATEPRAYQYPRFSPDGSKVALDLRDQQNDVWALDLARTTLTRLTTGRFSGGPSIWDGTGSSVVFGPHTSLNLHLQPASGGAPRRLMTSPNIQFADDVTPDGAWLIFSESEARVGFTGGFDVRRLRLNPPGEPEDLVVTSASEQNADVSPDGRWLAYQSDESGRFEVYVRPFQQADAGRWQVSSTGGTRPLWSRDGRELFYLDAARRMTVVAVTPSSAVAFGRPATLFETASLGLEGAQRNFDLSPDGRFLMVRNLAPPNDVPTLVLVQHWQEAPR